MILLSYYDKTGSGDDVLSSSESEELGHLARFPPYQWFTVLIKLLVSCKQAWDQDLLEGLHVPPGDTETWTGFRQVEENGWMDVNGSKHCLKSHPNVVRGSSDII